MNKKGDVISSITDNVLNIIFGAIVILFVILMIKSFSTSLSTSSIIPQFAKDGLTTALTNLKFSYNILPLVFYLGMIIASVIVIRKGDYNLISIVWVILLIGYIVAIFTIPTTVFDGLKDKSSDIQDISNDMPIWDYIFTHFVEFGMVFLIITGIALATREKEDEQI